MPRSQLSTLTLLLFLMLASIPARADLYAASAAIEAKDHDRAFQLFRELAELGRLEAQESLAISYVNGEGVKRDNVLGLGWAMIARENGGGGEMQRLIDQLSPHMNDRARQRLAELRAQFGKEALQERLIPQLPSVKKPVPNKTCTYDRPFRPRPPMPIGLSGQVLPTLQNVALIADEDGLGTLAGLLFDPGGGPDQGAL